MNIRQSHVFQHLGTYLFLIVLSLFVLFHLLIIFSQSLMTNQQVNHWPPPLLPETPILDNYRQVFAQPDLKLAIWLGNSIYAATAYSVAVLLICTPAAYAFARLRFPGRNILFG